jgi:hypothetical protein
MLSLDECRQILSLPHLPDDEVAEVRDTLYTFAQAFIDAIVKQASVILPRQPHAHSK